MRDAPAPTVMYQDQTDPKQPRPTRRACKGNNVWESAEAGDLREVGPGRKDAERDHHRHVRI